MHLFLEGRDKLWKDGMLYFSTRDNCLCCSCPSLFLKRSGRPFAAGPCANAPRVTAALLRAQTDMAPPSLKGPRALPMSSSQPSSKNIPPGDVLCDVGGEWKALSAALAA